MNTGFKMLVTLAERWGEGACRMGVKESLYLGGDYCQGLSLYLVAVSLQVLTILLKITN